MLSQWCRAVAKTEIKKLKLSIFEELGAVEIRIYQPPEVKSEEESSSSVFVEPTLWWRWEGRRSGTVSIPGGVPGTLRLYSSKKDVGRTNPRYAGCHPRPLQQDLRGTDGTEAVPEDGSRDEEVKGQRVILIIIFF